MRRPLLWLGLCAACGPGGGGKVAPGLGPAAADSGEPVEDPQPLPAFEADLHLPDPEPRPPFEGLDLAYVAECVGDRDCDGVPPPIDCDDTDAQSYPGAPELCGDGVVNNCDRRDEGWTAEHCTVVTETLIEIGKTSGGFAEGAAIGDLRGDGSFFFGLGAPSVSLCAVIGTDEWGAEVYECHRRGMFYLLEPAAFELGAGNALWLPRPGATGVHTIVGHLDDWSYGSSLEGLGDLDGDGFADFIIGNDQTGRGPETDEAWLFWGPGIPGAFDEGTRLIVGDDPLRCIGYDMEAAGDLTADGVNDLVVGDPCGNEAWVLSGVDVLGATGESLAPVARVVSSAAEPLELGMGVNGLHDLTGDGLADLVVSAPNADNGVRGPDLDFVGVYEGPLTGDRDADDRAATVRSGLVLAERSEHTIGYTLDVGDLNGDGYADLVVADPSWSDATNDLPLYGLTTVYFGPLRGDYVDIEAEVQLYRTGRGEVDAHTDFDGDGRDDLLVGSGIYPREVGFYTYRGGSGEAYLLFSPMGGSLLLRSDADVIFSCGDRGSPCEAWGAQVMAVPDHSGDGVPDVIVGTDGDYFWLMPTPLPTR